MNGKEVEREREMHMVKLSAAIQRMIKVQEQVAADLVYNNNIEPNLIASVVRVALELIIMHLHDFIFFVIRSGRANCTTDTIRE